ncbi:MAG: serine/threonine-protein kinase [Bacteroidota bacterium]
MPNLTPEQWQQLQLLFHELTTLPTVEEQQAFLADHQRDETLGGVLQAMYEEHLQQLTLLDNPAEALADFPVDTAALPQALPPDLLNRLDADRTASTATLPSRVGPYALRHELGRGGMGTVYLAQRDDGAYDQLVAIKVLRRGLDTDDMLRRFATERQILASLNHPHIARLLDGGALDDGRLYFVMEYVEGVPITTYCQHHQLSLDARLAIFQTVCHAVHYAHQNLIVHRDLKPQNILVTADGTVKLLDFGIAKLLDPSSAQMTMAITAASVRLLTPEYAAPEQVRGQAITTGTDVYSLGVLLVELLTGRRPYQLPSRVQREVERIICEEPPTLPSTLVRSGDDLVMALPADRLQKKLKAGLDDIALMSLRKEPSRRYASAEALAQDISNYLNGQPLQAKPDTWGYRLRLFVKRNRTLVGATALVILSLLGGMGSTLWQAQRAEQERASAVAVSDFMQDLFATANPELQERRDTLRAGDLLKAGIDEANRRFAEQPHVKARLLFAIGNAYQGLGQYRPGYDALQQALGLAAGTFGEDHPLALAAQIELGQSALQVSNYAEADSLLAIAYASAKAGDHKALLVEAAYHRAALEIRQGSYAQAFAYAEECLALMQELPPDPQLLGDTYNALAFAIGHRGQPGDLSKSVEYSELAIEQLALYSGVDHVFVAEGMNTLGITLSRLGRFDEAMETHTEALRIRRLTYPPDHPYLGVSLLNMGVVAMRQNDFPYSIQLHEEALEVFGQSVGPEDGYYYGYTVFSMGSAYKLMGDVAAARQYFDQSYTIMLNDLGPDHADTVAARDSLAAIDGPS